MSGDGRTLRSSSRQENEVILQEEFSIPNCHETVTVKLTAEALLWTTRAKRGFAFNRLFSHPATLTTTRTEDDDRHLIPTSPPPSASMKSSLSFPNGFRVPEQNAHRLNISDVVGCDVAKSDFVRDRQTCYLRIYAYPMLKKFLWKDSVRKRKEIVFGLARLPTFAENREALERWQSEIRKCIRRLSSSSLEVEPRETEDHKKLLVLVNPFSGAGKALHLFQSRIIPVLAEAGMPYEAVVTKYSGHAMEMVKDLDLTSWSGIVVVSGDGLIYEVINGLMERRDGREAIKTPIGALPGGSGNALSTSILYQAGETAKHNIITSSALLVAKNRIQPMDLVALDTCTGSRLYSFLSVAWGIVSDIDIESEKFRNLGNARFTVGAVSRILNLRKYSGKLHFLPINPAYKCKWSSYDKSPCEITMGCSNNSNSSSRRNLESTPNASNSSFVCSSLADESNRPSVLPTPLLAPLDGPVPSNWTTMTASDFVSVMAVYQTHLGQDLFIFPHSRLKDGCIYLAVARGNVSRYKLLQFFTAMQTGTLEILEDDCCEVIKVAAFRLEPGDNKGIVAVDGEVVDCGPIQGQVVEGLARVFS